MRDFVGFCIKGLRSLSVRVRYYGNGMAMGRRDVQYMSVVFSYNLHFRVSRPDCNSPFHFVL